MERKEEVGMKPIEEILKNPRISNPEMGMDGFKATISMSLWTGSVICSKGGGWEHVSVSPYKKKNHANMG